VELWLHGKKVGEDTEKPFEFNLPIGKEEGQQKLTIKAYHSDGEVFESDELNITVQSILGLEDANPEEIGFKVYPNPGIDRINVILNSDKSERINITLSNTILQSVQEERGFNLKPGENNLEIDINHLKTGLYILILEIDGKRFTKKIMKK
ncbi:unnamed protein product, partial [Scytosiphon promiscuus]